MGGFNFCGYAPELMSLQAARWKVFEDCLSLSLAHDVFGAEGIIPLTVVSTSPVQR